MLTVIPRDKFARLMRKTPLEEDTGKSLFSMDEVWRISDAFDNYTEFVQKVQDYLRDTYIRFIGKGSSRTAFFIPPGSVAGDKSVPCCLKIAYKDAGIAQNTAELNIFDKYGKLPCFPKMYASDVRGRFILTEVGEPAVDEDINSIIKSWDGVASKVVDDKVFREAYGRGIKIRYSGVSEVVYFTQKFQKRKIFYKNYPEIKKNVIDKMCALMKNIEPIAGMVDFSYRGGWAECIPDDLRTLRNWATVVRDGVKTSIPIDWGFTEDVFKTYYK